MPIYIDEENKIFHLQADCTSYVLKVYKSLLLGNLYWGARLENQDLSQLVFLRDKRKLENLTDIDYEHNQDMLYQEYSGYGNTDFRSPAFQISHPDGSSLSNLRYKSYKLSEGKPALKDLPATWCSDNSEASTLIITMEDTLAGLEIDLLYSIFHKSGALARSAQYRNVGSKPLRIQRAFSSSVDLDPQDLDFIHLSGSWARERDLVRQELRGGTHSIESTRGISSHQQNPLFILASRNCNEETGTAYGFNLVYSGNFLAQAEVDQFGSIRASLGINPFDFTWNLDAGKSFQTPEAILVYSDAGLGTLSRRFHKLYQENLVRGSWAHKERPILVNNWEATYFNFNADKILEIAKAGAELGIELFVLDDGWFGHRDSDNSSLGDWFEDRRKLPKGLKDLAEGVKKEGLLFGLWFEPEMISPDSELYKAHPDWCLHVDGRHRTEIRNQYVLDLSRQDVRDAIIEQVSAILKTVPISYVKWDMNRPLTEMGSAKLQASQQREIAHRYVLGVYDMMERITSAFPEILFEGCAGGGARFDPGILYYMPQIWTSDDSDAIQRLKLQYATSLAYPVSTMGAHVSAVPNHQVGRITPLETRGNVAMSGNFGYELDLTKFGDDEKTEVKAQVAWYKNHRKLIQTGELYRLKSPFLGNETAWMIVAEDKSEAMLMYARVLGVPNPGFSTLKLAGLDPKKLYSLEGNTKYTVSGELLMKAGVRLPNFWGDFQSALWYIKAL